MEEQQDGDFRAPYWLTYSNSFRRIDSSSSFSFSSGTASNSFRRTGFVIILLLAATAAFIPSLSSFSFKQSGKNGWDYFNLLLVLFAILCGFFSRNSNGNSTSSYAASLKSNSSTPRSSSFDLRSSSSSSDPDLRHESLVSHTDDRRRFFDDIDTQIYRSRRWTEEEEHEERIHDAVAESQSELIEDQVKMMAVRTYKLPPPPPPLPPSPPPLYDFYCEQKIDNNEKMSGSAETKDFLTAFRKKKKLRQKSVESFDIDRLFGSSDSQLPPPSPPPPPPPPPPPFKVPDWKFVMRGNYVRLESANASRRSWPDPIDDMEGIQSGVYSPSTSSTGASEATSLAFFCPSPDVNTKADNFIASFRARLQLEKVNSLRRRTELNLGPDPILDPGPAL